MPFFKTFKTKTDVITQSLKESDKPHLYLLNIGLSQNEYNLITAMTEEHRRVMAFKIVSKCTEAEILKIIYDLTVLEFSREATDPIRAGNNLLGQVIRSYVHEKEVFTFPQYYYQHEDGSWGNYSGLPVTKPVRNLWATVERAVAEKHPSRLNQFQNQTLKSLPYFYYQQLLVPTELKAALDFNAQQRQALAKTQIAEFHKKMQGNTNIPVFPADLDLITRLEDIKIKILNTPWKVGRGLKYNNHPQKLPHRIHAILTLIDKVKSNQLDAKTAYKQIIEKAFDAIENPRWGRQESTTEKYREIFTHSYILEDQPVAELSISNSR